VYNILHNKIYAHITGAFRTGGNIKLDVQLQDESVWVTQEQMQNLFGKSKATISEHIKNVFAEGELDKKLCY